MGEDQGGRVIDSPDSSRGWITAVDAESGRTRWKLPLWGSQFSPVSHQLPEDLCSPRTSAGMSMRSTPRVGVCLWETDPGQSIGGGVVAYLAGGRELIGIASGMRSATVAADGGAGNKVGSSSTESDSARTMC